MLPCAAILLGRLKNQLIKRSWEKNIVCYGSAFLKDVQLSKKKKNKNKNWEENFSEMIATA